MLATPAPSLILDDYLAQFTCLFGDTRSRTTFQAIVQGILTAGSLVCTRIAAQAPLLSNVQHGSQRVLRFATADSTQRSSVTASRLVGKLGERGVASLGQTPTSTEVWLILDGSNLRKPHAKQMPDLMRVRSLQGTMVNGYHTINVLGVTPQHRALLYHRLFSSKEKDHLSESHEVQRALKEVGATLAPIQAEHPLTWIMDSGFDDQAVWRTVWEQGQHVLCRVQHMDRLVQYTTSAGQWRDGHVVEACDQLRGQGKVQTSMVVRLKGQRYEKRQSVSVQLSSCPIQVSYEPDVRRGGPGKGEGAKVTQAMWLLKVEILDSHMEPWYLLTDWPTNTPAQAARIFQMYRQRWSVEEAFQFLKMCVGWESVQVLDLEGVRTLVALGWVAAGFLYEIDGGWEWVDVELLAKLGGFEPHKGRKPGKKILLWGLQRVLDYMVTQALLRQHKAATGSIPPGVAALLGEDALRQL
ncbi:MAG: transposase [Chloroflexota bacterium]